VLCDTHFGLGNLEKEEIKKFINSRKKPLPLSGAGELKPLLQVEEEGARLAKFLDVNLEGLK